MELKDRLGKKISLLKPAYLDYFTSFTLISNITDNTHIQLQELLLYALSTISVDAVVSQ